MSRRRQHAAWKCASDGRRSAQPFSISGQPNDGCGISGRSVFLGEMLPQDLKLELDQISRKEAEKAARFLAGVVGKAHGRQMDVTVKHKWKATLKANRSKTLDAPSWSWTCILELTASHEMET